MNIAVRSDGAGTESLLGVGFKFRTRYEWLVMKSPDGLIVLDQNKIIKFANPAAEVIFGSTAEKLEGQTFECLVDVNGTATEIEIIKQDKNNLKIIVEALSTAIQWNRKPAILVCLRDVTKRKFLEQSNVALENFAYTASHDLQDPLRKVIAFGDALSDECANSLNPIAKEYLARMRNATVRMQRLLEDLLKFSKINSHDLELADIDLNTTIATVLEDLEVNIKEANAIIEVQPLPTLRLNEALARELFQNLISNALKFHKKDVQLLISVSAQLVNNFGNQMWEIKITDNGIGFDEQYKEKIFEQFVRLHGKNTYEGTGMGLAICRKIADKFGGAVVASSKVGSGSVFSVLLQKA